MATRRWKCLVCGYIHNGEEPPESCPACGADKTNFAEVDAEGKKIETEQEESQEVTPPAENQEETPEAEKEIAEESAEEVITEPEVATEDVEEDAQEEKKEVVESGTLGPDRKPPVEKSLEKNKEKPKKEDKKKPSRSFLSWVGGVVLKLHLHPITVHTPNGILPMAIIFLALVTFYNYQSFELAFFYSMIFVLATMPVVLFTGYMEWQMRYRGAKTYVFITKILCSLIVLATVSTLVIWRIIDPGVAGPDSPLRLTYFGVGAASVIAAGIAGHLGGKLVFATRGN